MSSTNELVAGVVGSDKENDSSVYILALLEEQADEYVYTYDYDKNPVTISEHETNADYDDSDLLVRVVYTSDLDRIFSDWQEKDSDVIQGRVEEDTRVRKYVLPRSRVTLSD